MLGVLLSARGPHSEVQLGTLQFNGLLKAFPTGFESVFIFLVNGPDPRCLCMSMSWEPGDESAAVSARVLDGI